MFPFVVLLLFIVLQEGQTQEVITPLWSCWFPTYHTSQRKINLVFGYNNHGSDTTTIGIGTEHNVMTPLELDGNQPLLFKAGTSLLDFALNDFNNTLTEGHPIVWTLNGQSVTVVLGDIVESNRCDVKHHGACPMWIDHFCDDSSFCNGIELCSSPDLNALTQRVMGQCKNQSVGVICQPGFACSEESLRCIDSTPPPPPPPSIIPSFHCWFYALGEDSQTMIFHIALNYNNTGSNILIRPITSSDSSPLRNEFLPSVYNNKQPTVFYSGFKEDAYVLKDTVNLLATPDGVITWRLSDRELQLTKDLITNENKCGGGGGGAQQQQPTSQPTLPQEEEEVRIHTKQCSGENPDCTAFDSFCNGPYQCDIDAELCVQIHPEFSPCHSHEMSITSGTPVRITCVEHLSICVATVNCTVNSECNDGLLCNGKETCSNGTCVGQVNVTIEELCGTVNAICIEGQGCIATNLTVSKPIVAGLSGGLVAGVLFISLILGWYFSDKRKLQEERAKRSRRG